jgi:hypothetical protein
MEPDRVEDTGTYEQLAEAVQRAAAERFRTLAELVSWSVERGLWFLRQRVAWPIADSAAVLGTRGCIGVGGGTAFLLATVGTAVVLLAGAGSEPVAAPASPVAAVSVEQPRLIFIGAAAHKPTAPRQTLQGPAPVFASKAGGSEARLPLAKATPESATISSDPKNSVSKASTPAVRDDVIAARAQASAAHARAAVPSGPPAGPAAVKVAREFARGFVVYETGGEASSFRDAFKAAATPELAKALLRRPPKQPAGARVPRAKVLNVVAGPSQGTVYAVSVSLLRVGVTSELRLQMERIEKGKRAEWRVTSVLG